MGTYDELRPLFERAFADGCGQELDELELDGVTSRMLDAQRTARSHLGPGSLELAALHAGHLSYGRAMAATGDEALGIGRSEPETEVWLERLGSALVEAASRDMPYAIKKLAADWAGGDAERQLELLPGVVDALLAVYRSADEAETDDDDAAGDGVPDQTAAPEDESWFSDTFKEYRHEQVLPAQYRTGTEDATAPNCLGLAIVLAAFGRLCGARILTTQLVEDKYGPRRRAKLEFLDALITDVESRGFRAAAELVAESKRVRQAISSVRSDVSDFHFAVAIELADGRWVHLDPFMGNWATFRPVWDMAETYARLERFSIVLPGLSLVRHDHGEMECACEAVIEGFEELIAGSWQVQQELQEVPVGLEVLRHIDTAGQAHFAIDEGFHAAYETVCASGPYRDLYDRLLKLKGLAPAETADVGISWMISVVYDRDGATAPANTEEIDDDRVMAAFLSWDVQHQFDDDYARAREEEALTLFHEGGIAIAEDAIERIGKGDDLVHPALEFGRPEYTLALAVINQLRCWTRPDIRGSLLMPYSSSPMYWHDAADIMAGTANDAAVRAAEAVVRPLEVLHPAILNKLSYLDRFRLKEM